MILPLLREDHVNNHISLGVPPPNTDMQTPCQVEVTPCKSEGIEPFTLVNSLPGQVRAMPLQPINTLSVPCEVASSVSSQVPLSMSPSVAPVSPLTSSTSVLVSITDIAPPVTSLVYPLPPDPSSTPLDTTQV